VRAAVVGAGTTSVFDEASQSDDRSLEVAFSPCKGILPLVSTMSLVHVYFQDFMLSVNQFVPFLCSSALGKVLGSELPRSKLWS
jgi:hypothetical protein